MSTDRGETKLSTNGINIFAADRKSIDACVAALDRAAQWDGLCRNLLYWQEECVKLHSQLDASLARERALQTDNDKLTSLLNDAESDCEKLILERSAGAARERALREALAKAMDPRPAKQCPNCGDWTHLSDCNHSSSGPTGTLYGVCKKCADRHAAFSAALQGETK